MSIEQNKATLLRWFKAVQSLDFDNPDWGKLDEEIDALYDPGYMFHDPSFVNKQGLQDMKEWMRDQFADVSAIELEIQEMIGEGEAVSTRGVLTLTSKSTGKGEPLLALIVSHFRDGKIHEEWQLLGPYVP